MDLGPSYDELIGARNSFSNVQMLLASLLLPTTVSQLFLSVKDFLGTSSRVVRWKSTDLSNKYIASIFRIEE
jgi:hypothetical protein